MYRRFLILFFVGLFYFPTIPFAQTSTQRTLAELKQSPLTSNIPDPAEIISGITKPSEIIVNELFLEMKKLTPDITFGIEPFAWDKGNNEYVFDLTVEDRTKELKQAYEEITLNVVEILPCGFVGDTFRMTPPVELLPISLQIGYYYFGANSLTACIDFTKFENTEGNIGNEFFAVVQRLGLDGERTIFRYKVKSELIIYFFVYLPSEVKSGMVLWSAYVAEAKYGAVFSGKPGVIEVEVDLKTSIGNDLEIWTKGREFFDAFNLMSGLYYDGLDVYEDSVLEKIYSLFDSFHNWYNEEKFNRDLKNTREAILEANNDRSDYLCGKACPGITVIELLTFLDVFETLAERLRDALHIEIQGLVDNAFSNPPIHVFKKYFDNHSCWMRKQMQYFLYQVAFDRSIYSYARKQFYDSDQFRDAGVFGAKKNAMDQLWKTYISKGGMIDLELNRSDNPFIFNSVDKELNELAGWIEVTTPSSESIFLSVLERQDCNMTSTQSIKEQLIREYEGQVSERIGRIYEIIGDIS